MPQPPHASATTIVGSQAFSFIVAQFRGFAFLRFDVDKGYTMRPFPDSAPLGEVPKKAMLGEVRLNLGPVGFE
jgi:hypothetical protein